MKLVSVAVFLCAIGSIRATAAPAISAGGVLNGSGYQPVLAPGAIFVLFGAGLGPTSIVLAPSTSYPNALGGTSVTFTPSAGGASFDAKMVYVLDRQLAGQLPSTVPPGTYNVRVSFGGQTSASETVRVVERSIGLATVNSAGTGPVQATIGNVNAGASLVRLTSGTLNSGGLSWTLTPAHPGDTLVLWGTGGGADLLNDSGGSSGDQSVQGGFQVLLGSKRITATYAGTSTGYPGLWQINFVIPTDIATDCLVPLKVLNGGETSNRVTIAIAPFGELSCASATLSRGILTKIDSGASITKGSFHIGINRNISIQFELDFATGGFFQYSAANYAMQNSGLTFGPCFFYETALVNGEDPASLYANALDAGPQLRLSSPVWTAPVNMTRAAAPSQPTYATLFPPQGFGPGEYTLAGAGGTQVAAFTAKAAMGTSITVTNLSGNAIDRSKPLTINWTGSGLDEVSIQIGTQRSATTKQAAWLSCNVSAASGTFTIPTAALAGLLPTSADQTAYITIDGHPFARQFDASLPGIGQIDVGVFGTELSVSTGVSIK